MIRLGIMAEDEKFADTGILSHLRDLGYDVESWPGCRKWDEATLIERCRNVEVVLTGRASPKLPTRMASEGFGRLKWLCHFHGTIRHLVEKPLVEAGLIVTNWGEAVSGVAEGAMALLLACLKQLPELDHVTRTHEDRRIWQAFPCTLKGTSVGLYGYGPIGRHMGRMLQAFEADVAIYDPFARDVPANIRVCTTLRELFATCPIISIHCGLNDATRHSVTREVLDLLPQGGILINTARGAVVKEDDLAAALAGGRLWAGIDVIEDERGMDAWQRTPLAKAPNVVLTRHGIGGGKGYPPDAQPRPKLPDFVVENLNRFREGRPLINVITAQIYDLKT